MKKNKIALLWGIAVLLVIAVTSGIFIFKDELFGIDSNGSGTNHYNKSYENETYESQVQSIQDIEYYNPTDFLETDGTYRENLLGNKIVINGTITNTSSSTTYKEHVIEVLFYSGNDELLDTEKHIIYKSVRPNSTIDFELRVKNYSNVYSLGWEIIDAEAK